MSAGPLSDELCRQWETDGWCLMPSPFTAHELASAVEGLHRSFPTAEEYAEARRRDESAHRPIREAWDAIQPRFPFDSGALNRLAMHDALIDLAEQLLGTPEVRMYQALATAKYSDGAPDYEQLLHVDYLNHSLVVPRPDAPYQHLELFVYLSDVTAATAATRILSRDLTSDIPVERAYLHLEEHADLYAAEVPAEGPMGTVLAYRPDVYHRGVGLTAPDAARFLLHVAYKPLHTDWLGFQCWPYRAEGLEWYRFMQHTNVRQLTVLGFPPPGHPYWNAATLDGVAARYPSLDMTPWREAWPGAGGRA